MQDPATYQQQINPQFPEHEHEHLKCPRCDSSNTKFCYYNNYNLSQPRHFCKNCRRYWTKGGALRNIPVGGGSRKNAKRTQNPRRSASSPSSSSPSVPKPEPSGEYGLSAQEAYDQDRRVLDFGVGSFGSLLESSGQFGSLLEGLSPRGRGSTVQLVEFGESQNPNSESDVIRNPRVELQSSQNSEGYLDGWPDLSMYTPGSTFQ